jgi:hypothetical protein
LRNPHSLKIPLTKISTPLKTPLNLCSDIHLEDYMPLATLATLAYQAFILDIETCLKNLNLPTTTISDTDICSWLSSPACNVVKAVSVEGNEIMGSICWITRGYLPRPQ